MKGLRSKCGANGNVGAQDERQLYRHTQQERSMKTLIAVVSFLFAVNCFAVALPKEQVGKMYLVDGKVWGVMEGSKSPLQKDSPVFEGMTIVSETGSQALILFGKKVGIMKVGPSTEMKVIEGKNNKWTLQLIKGLAATSVRKELSPKPLFQVKTPGATAGVRGTTFFLKVEDKDHVFFCPCEGKIDLMAGSDKITVESKHHDYPKRITVGTGKLADRAVASDMGKEHSDSDVETLKKILESP